MPVSSTTASVPLSSAPTCTSIVDVTPDGRSYAGTSEPGTLPYTATRLSDPRIHTTTDIENHGDQIPV